MRHWHRLPVAAAALLSALLGLARAATALDQPLTLERAVRLALERSNDLGRLANQVTLGEASLSQARAQSRPDLSLSISPSERLGRTFDQSLGRVENQRSEGLSLRAASSLTVYDAAMRPGVRAAHQDLAASRQDLARGQQSVAYEAATRFLGALSAGEVLRVQEENVVAQQQQLQRIQAYWEQGTRSKVDLLQQQATLASAEMSLVSARQNHELALLDLRQTLQLGAEEPLQLVAPARDDQEHGQAQLDAPRLAEEALAGRADVESQKARIAAAQEAVRQARAGALPSVSLSLSGGSSYSSLNHATSFADQIGSYNPSASIGLGLSLPVLDQERTRAAVARAQVTLRNEELALDTQERAVATGVQQAVLGYRSAWQRLQAAQAQRAAASEALDAMQTRYSTGAATFVELSQTRAQHVEAEATWVESVYGVTQARLAVAFQQGGEHWSAALAALTPSQTP